MSVLSDRQRDDSGKDISIEISRRGAVRVIRRCIGEQTPSAVVRFGEGEGRLLGARADDEQSMRIASRKLGKQTGLTFSPRETLKVRNLVLNALDRADILGLRDSASFSDEHREWMDLIYRAYADRVAKGRKPTYVTHCLLNNDLRDALPTILEGQQRLSVVSCRNIGPTLKADHGLDNVTEYQIPSQYVVRDIDGPYEATLHEVPIWPDFYRRLRAEITVQTKGEVFLVGAGILGKDLCIRIKDLGGIALDMGSTLDSIAGKVTRGRNRPEFRPPPEVPKVV